MSCHRFNVRMKYFCHSCVQSSRFLPLSFPYTADPMQTAGVLASAARAKGNREPSLANYPSLWVSITSCLPGLPTPQGRRRRPHWDHRPWYRGPGVGHSGQGSAFSCQVQTYHSSVGPSPEAFTSSDAGPKKPTDQRIRRLTDVELPGSDSRDSPRPGPRRLRKYRAGLSFLKSRPGFQGNAAFPKAQD